MPISSNVLKKYANRASIFIETGTHRGKTVDIASRLGFNEIYSIELSNKLFERNVKKFSSLSHITIIHGNSGVKLAELLLTIDKPCVFWLDAHYSGGDTEKSSCPIYDELEAIRNHKIKNHTILIDDMRGFGKRVVAEVMAINPKYNITYEDSKSGRQVFKNDILVAVVS